MNVETKPIELWSTGKGITGHITLDKLANSETMKITLLGKEIIPESFDILGHPKFTKEQALLFWFKEEELKRRGAAHIPLQAVIVYEERNFDVPRSTFDTIRGIQQSLTSLSALNEMLSNRSLFVYTHKEERLNEFILFGTYLLDRFGQILSVVKSRKDTLISAGDVEYYEIFKRINNVEAFSFVGHGYVIPRADSVCPCCGKVLPIDDLKNNPCVYEDGKIYHDVCYRNYRKLTEVDKLTRRLMDIVYKSGDYQFELLPNGYCSQDCCSHIPWILFHTIDGDIIMGWRKRVISIEWQENYKPFDMDKLFGTEDVTKWETDGKRGIHAWGDEKAYEYLKKVRNTVHPNYSK